MYKTALLQLSLMALTFCVIGGKPMSSQVQKRFILQDAVDTFTSLRGQFGKAVGGVRDWFSDTQTSDDNMELGQEMIDRGKHLLELATNLSQKAYDEVTDPQNRQKIKDALDTVTQAATDVVNAGYKVVQNKGKITAAMQDSYKDLSNVAKDSLKPLQDNLSLTKDSIKKAGGALAAAGISAKDSAVALAAALKEMVETSDLIAKANARLEAVGRNLMSFGKGLLDAGLQIGKSIGDGTKKLVKASGLWDQNDQD